MMDFLQYTSGYDYIILNGMFDNSKGGAIYYIGLLLNEQSNRRAIIDCLIGNVLAWQEILDGSTTQEESIQFRERQMGSIGGLSKLKLTMEWYIKEMSGVDNTEMCYLHCTRF